MEFPPAEFSIVIERLFIGLNDLVILLNISNITWSPETFVIVAVIGI